ncbi:N-acetylmuramoyl-L-alanine amidase family protein [Romboutsia sp.]|uniref:N-acetylmuramoyl-L-alanine amidase family protein n=1 Tax=Romboutsia sp. TaxID=1965302 RepID=UPI003F3DE9A5
MEKIVIDCGHGGGDSGAFNKKLNVMEKHINLEVGKIVYNKLLEYNCKVVMTRNSDVNLSLVERVKRSNNVGASRFISIHCNSFSDEKANGFEVWVYDNKNNLNLGQDILNSLNDNIDLRNRGIKESKEYYVTKYTKCKACIVEIGFMSNTEECKYMLNNIDKCANAITQGIVKNLKLNKKNDCECKCH